MCIPLFNNILNFFCFVKYRDINNLEKESQVKIDVFGFFHFVRPSIVNDPLCPFFFNRSKKNYRPFSICIVCFSLNSSVKLFFSIRSFVYKNDRFSFLGKIVHPSFVFSEPHHFVTFVPKKFRLFWKTMSISKVKTPKLISKTELCLHYLRVWSSRYRFTRVRWRWEDSGII